MVGLLDAQWGRSAPKSHIFVCRNRLNTENPTSTHNTQQQEDRMPGNVGHWPLPLPMALRRLFQSNVPPCHITGDIGYVWLLYFVLGGKLCHIFYQCVLKQNFAYQGRRPPRPLPPPLPVCCPFQCNSPAHHKPSSAHAWWVNTCAVW